MGLRPPSRARKSFYLRKFHRLLAVLVTSRITSRIKRGIERMVTRVLAPTDWIPVFRWATHHPNMKIDKALCTSVNMVLDFKSAQLLNATHQQWPEARSPSCCIKITTRILLNISYLRASSNIGRFMGCVHSLVVQVAQTHTRSVLFW